MQLTLRKNRRLEKLLLKVFNKMERILRASSFGGMYSHSSEKECSDFLNSVILVIFIMEENKREHKNRENA